MRNWPVIPRFRADGFAGAGSGSRIVQPASLTTDALRFQRSLRNFIGTIVMQTVYKRLGVQLSQEDRQTIAMWQKRVGAFYGALFIIFGVLVFVGLERKEGVFDGNSRISEMTAPSEQTK
jgi:hypothetical protein